jgi:hypothetical protein
VRVTGVLDVDKLHVLTPIQRNADAAERWADAVRRFVGMTHEELSAIYDSAGDELEGLDADEYMLLAVDALDQAGFDVERLALVAK